MCFKTRSQRGIETNTDHKLVKMDMGLTWWKLKNVKTKAKRLDIEKLEYAPIKE